MLFWISVSPSLSEMVNTWMILIKTFNGWDFLFYSLQTFKSCGMLKGLRIDKQYFGKGGSPIATSRPQHLKVFWSRHETVYLFLQNFMKHQFDINNTSASGFPSPNDHGNKQKCRTRHRCRTAKSLPTSGLRARPTWPVRPTFPGKYSCDIHTYIFYIYT